MFLFLLCFLPSDPQGILCDLVDRMEKAPDEKSGGAPVPEAGDKEGENKVPVLYRLSSSAPAAK